MKIIAVGKLKERYLKEGIEEYSKRLRASGGLEIIEVTDEKIPEKPSEKEMNQIKRLEGERILSKLKENEKVIALTLDGELLTSPELEARVTNWTNYGTENLSFIIGGSLGLSKAVTKRADFCLSFGYLTLPHQLMRLVLIEQIYRIMMIHRGSVYHK